MAAENPNLVPDPNQADPVLGQTQRSCPKCGLLVSPALSSCPNDGTLFEKPVSRISQLAGQYEFISEIGAGGMGVIYKARHLGLNRLVAIKMLHVNRLDDQRIRRFQQEAKAVSNLDHPAIVRVYDFGVSETGQPHLVLDFIDGQNLEQVIKAEGSLPILAVTSIFSQICDAIEHAHNKGILHRDIKPSNIMLIDGPDGAKQVKIVDFGIAKIIDPSPEQGVSLTATGEVFGSPLYMSPEQGMGKKLDGRSDVYSAGCVLFECLTGAPPFIAANAFDTIMKHCSDQPPTLREASLGKEFSPEFERVAERVLAKDPDDRYQTMGELKHAIIDASKAKSGDQFGAAARQQAQSLLQRRGLFVAVAGLLLFSAGGVWLVSLPVAKPLPGKNASEAQRKGENKDAQTGHERSAVNPSGAATKPTEDEGFAPSALFINSEQPGKDLFIRQVNTPDNRQIRANYLSTDEHLDALRDISPGNITEAYFEKTSLSGRGLSNLKHFPLKLLSLNGSHGISSEGMACVGSLTTLEELRLDDTPTTDERLPNIGDLENLKTLTLRRTQVSGSGLSYLAKRLRHLENLDVTGCPYIGDLDMSIFSEFKSLKVLQLKDLSKITDKGLESLRSCARLTGLNLSGTNIGDRGLKMLSTMRNLSCLYLIDCPKVTEKGLLDIKRKIPAIRLVRHAQQT
jgi:serine/threonine protein kinase